MGKSLGDYNVEKSSSADITNIKWTQKRRADPDRPRKKKARNTSPFNIIYRSDSKENKPAAEGVFIIACAGKSKGETKGRGKKFQNSSASICKIKQGFIRPAR